MLLEKVEVLATDAASASFSVGLLGVVLEDMLLVDDMMGEAGEKIVGGLWLGKAGDDVRYLAAEEAMREGNRLDAGIRWRPPAIVLLLNLVS